MLILAAAAATVFATGCASMNRGRYSDVHEPVNTLAFTTVTEPEELVKWSGASRYLQMGMRSMDLYYFQVPNQGSEPVPRTAAWERSGDLDASSTEMMGAPGSYQSESQTRSFTVIRHQPGSAR